MAKKNSEELLSDILNLLDEVIKENKKATKNAGASNVPNTAIFTADAVSIKQLGNSLKILSSAITPLAKISDDKIETIAKNIKLLGQAVREFGLDKETLALINNMLNAFIQIHNTISSISDNFMKSIIKLNPIKGRLLGMILGKFYGNVLRGMGTSFIMSLVWLFKSVPAGTVTIAKKAANLKLMSATMISILTPDNIKNFVLAGILLNQKKGENIGKFFKSLIDSLTGGRNDIEKAKTATKMALSIAVLIGTLTVSLVALTMLVAIGRGAVIGGLLLLGILVTGSYKLMKKLASLEFKTKSKESLVGVLAISALLLSLSLTLAITTSISKQNKLIDLVLGLAILAGLVFGSWQLMKKLSSTQFKNSAKNAVLGVVAIVSLLLGLSTAMLITIKLGKNGDYVLIGSALLLIFILASIGLFKLLSNNLTKTNVTNGLYAVGAVVGLIFGLGVAQLLTIKLGKNADEVMVGSVLLLVFTLASIGLFKLLSKKLNEKTITKALFATGSIAILMIGLGIAQLLTINLGKNWKDVLIGSGMLLVFTLASIGLFKLLSKKLNEKTISKVLLAVGAIVALMIGLGIAQLITIKLGKNAGDVLIGSVLLLVFTLASIGLFKLLSKSLKQSTIIKGLIATAGITLMIIGLSIAMRSFVKYLKQVKDITLKDTTKGILLLGGMVIGITVIATILGAFATSGGAILLAAGAAVLVGISLIISMMSRSMMKFTKLIEKVKKITPEDTKAAVSAIAGKGGMIGALIKIMAAFIPLSVMAPFAIAGIIAIRPVISTIGQFVDVIQKMASLKIADEWDPKTGKATHYMQLTPEAFKEAAKNLTAAFKTFLDDLNKGFQSFDIKSISIIKLLFPSQGKLSKSLSGEKPGIGTVIHMLGDFIDIIQKMASLSIPDKWDKNGKPISYKKLSFTDFTNAATTISTAFSEFLVELGKGLKGVGIKAAIALEFLSGPLGELLPGIAAIMNPIMQLAVGKLTVGDQVLDLNLENMKNASGDVVKVIEALINPLSELSAKNIDSDDIKEMVDSFAYAMNAFNQFADSFVFTQEFGKDGGYVDMAIAGFTKLSDFLNDDKFGGLNIFGEGVVNRSKKFKNMLENTAKGVKSIQPYLNATPKQIVELANAFKQLDNELIEKEEKRTKAIQTVSSNFKDMAENIQKLNDTMSQTMNLANKYAGMRMMSSDMLQQRGTEAIINATEKVNTSVKQAIENKNNSIDKDTNKDHMTQFAEIVSRATAQAVAAALDSWASQNKELVVKFDESPKTIFGNIEMG